MASASLFAQTITSEKSVIHVNTMTDREGKDESAPVISILSPAFRGEETLSVRQPDLTIIGHVEDESQIRSLFVNNDPADLDEENKFAANLALSDGENEISIIAIDEAGNFSEKIVIVHYFPELTSGSLSGTGKYYALIIGVDEYLDEAISNLDNAINDAGSLYRVLVSKYAFEEDDIVVLYNAKREDIINELDRLSFKITDQDNLLIYYAGHGWWDEEADIGYWLPSDAKQTSKAAWFRNSTLCDYLKEIKSRHTLLITDACFGGSIFKTRTAFSDAPKAINKLYELPSRKAMTSGTLTQVPDVSTFAKYLIVRLDTNSEKYLSSEQLFTSFRIAVINNSNAVPQYGEIRNVGDQGGDFIFI
ncbi:caspase family protein, partial [bacterium]|nr:caspase family protein [bacterium]